VGEVSNRRAWHEPAKLTAEVLEHYKRPLRARNWDAALVEVRIYCFYVVLSPNTASERYCQGSGTPMSAPCCTARQGPSPAATPRCIM